MKKWFRICSNEDLLQIRRLTYEFSNTRKCPQELNDKQLIKSLSNDLVAMSL
jgi:hypothetical protein